MAAVWTQDVDGEASGAYDYEAVPAVADSLVLAEFLVAAASSTLTLPLQQQQQQHGCPLAAAAAKDESPMEYFASTDSGSSGKSSPQGSPAKRKDGRMRMVAHRGSSHTAPENTLASLNLAFRQGACGVEFDVQKSSDGEIFLLHDDTLRRTAAAERPATLENHISHEEYCTMLDQDISTLSYWDFIQHIDVGSWKGGEYHRERPCLMKDAMETLPKGCFALCEVKGGDKATALAVTELAQMHGWTSEQLTFIGFDLQVMTEIKEKLISMDLGDISVIYVQDVATTEKALTVIKDAKLAGLDGVDFEADPDVVTNEVIQAAAEAGLQMGVWVWDKLPHSDTHPTASELNDRGIDFFTSDFPPMMCEWIAAC